MLVISRTPVFRARGSADRAVELLAERGHGVWIGPGIRVRVLQIIAGAVHLGIEAPQHVPIRRDELGEP